MNDEDKAIYAVSFLSGVASTFLVNEILSRSIKSWSPNKRRTVTGLVLCGGGAGLSAAKYSTEGDFKTPLLFSSGALLSLGVDVLCAPKPFYVKEPTEGEPVKIEAPPIKPEVTPDRTELITGDPQQNITKDFKLYQFACPQAGVPPEEYLPNVKLLADNLQVLKNRLGMDITFANGGVYRSPAFNSSIGGARNSMHMYAKAADIKVPSLTPAQVKATIEELISSGQMMQGGVGIYNTFVHYDVRGERARWDERK